MYLSDIQNKDIVSLRDGRRLGKIVDAYVTPQGKVEYFVVEGKKSMKNIFNSNTEEKLFYEKIDKIGSDVILVDM